MNMNIKKIKEISAKIKEYSLKIYADHIKTFDPLTLTYFPFVGWFIPMTIKRDDEFYMHHAKQGFVLAVFFAGVCTFLYFFYFFIPVHADILKFITVTIIYILYIAYCGLAYLGTKMIKSRETRDIPYVGVYVNVYTSKLNI